MNTVNNALILIVDDVPTNIQVLAEALRTDYRIKVATNGQDALELARQQPHPDLILLDAMMPGMDGFEVCGRLKTTRETQNIPVVFVTAKEDAMSEERGLNMGAVDYITKPFNLPIVRARVRNYLSLKHKTDMLESMAHIDSLTNVPNRRRFDETLEVEWRRCQRAESPLSLLMIDIDHFKEYNDNYGHGAGDVCLATIAATLATGLARAPDVVARYGGEEFAVILPDTTLDGAMQIAERLREDVANRGLPKAPNGDARSVTISVGCATTMPCDEDSPRALIEAADARLYQAKTSGRNQVCA